MTEVGCILFFVFHQLINNGIRFVVKPCRSDIVFPENSCRGSKAKEHRGLPLCVQVYSRMSMLSEINRRERMDVDLFAKTFKQWIEGLGAFVGIEIRCR